MSFKNCSPTKDVLHRSDRAMIYIFIAASYFPWLTLTPLPPDGWAAELWWLIWILASCGILYQQLFHERFKWLETTFYLFMGVAPALAIVSIVSRYSYIPLKNIHLYSVLLFFVTAFKINFNFITGHTWAV
jgi:channel protein (hemolysin III family)